MVIFHSFLYVYQRVTPNQVIVPGPPGPPRLVRSFQVFQVRGNELQPLAPRASVQGSQAAVVPVMSKGQGYHVDT